ncbi:hypothetical protein COO60DRAFT_1024587 [Scenedesmus sp. NREL 46B-D3]|nr:hypothetical protein COO60DRAFT_1024587 [Scenedesmus sp. NREL 46B-D3]
MCVIELMVQKAVDATQRALSPAHNSNKHRSHHSRGLKFTQQNCHWTGSSSAEVCKQVSCTPAATVLCVHPLYSYTCPSCSDAHRAPMDMTMHGKRSNRDASALSQLTANVPGLLHHTARLTYTSLKHALPLPSTCASCSTSSSPGTTSRSVSVACPDRLPCHSTRSCITSPLADTSCPSCLPAGQNNTAHVSTQQQVQA